MAPQIKEDVFKAIQEATTEKMPEEKVKNLANQVQCHLIRCVSR